MIDNSKKSCESLSDNELIYHETKREKLTHRNFHKHLKIFKNKIEIEDFQNKNNPDHRDIEEHHKSKSFYDKYQTNIMKPQNNPYLTKIFIRHVTDKLLEINFRSPDGSIKSHSIEKVSIRDTLRVPTFDNSFKTLDRSEFYEDFPVRWSRGLVFYELSDEFKKKCFKNLKKTLKKCISTINKQTLVKFLKKTEEVDDFVYFDINKKTRVTIGRYPGKNLIEINHNSESSHIYHYLMHILGFFHETNTQNSEYKHLGYITISNMPGNHIPDQQITNTFIPNFLGPYDNESILHLCACESQIHQPHQRFKPLNKLSKLDIRKINFFYGNRFCTYDYYKVPYFQTFFECNDCWGSSKLPICMYCKEFHHTGHKVTKYEFSTAKEILCACGINEHRMICSVEMKISETIEILRCLTCKNSRFQKPGVECFACFKCSKVCHQGHQMERVEDLNITSCQCGIENKVVSCCLKEKN